VKATSAALVSSVTRLGAEHECVRGHSGGFRDEVQATQIEHVSTYKLGTKSKIQQDISSLR
jgi:hypothetical protein